MQNLNEENLSILFLESNRFFKKFSASQQMLPIFTLSEEVGLYAQQPLYDLRKGVRDINLILERVGIDAELSLDQGQLSILDANNKFQLELWHEYDRYDVFFTANPTMDPLQAKVSLAIIIEAFHTLGFTFIIPDPEQRLYYRFFQLVDDPIVVFNAKNEIVVTNKCFTDLNIPWSFVMDARADKVEALKATYLIFRSRFKVKAEEFGLILLINEFKAREALGLTDKVGNFYSDLGIITSSIAHELNNPIAGILAGGETLKMLLGDDADVDIKEGVEALLASAQRCQELVRLFLSFSRKEQVKSEIFKTKELFENTLELLRNRMLEIGTRFQIDPDIKIEDWELKTNKALLTMLVYLLLNDMLTTLNKRELIEERSKNHKVSNYILEIHQSNNSLMIGLKSLAMEKKFTVDHLGKLIEYLVQMLNLNFEFTENGCRLSFLDS